MQRKLLLLLVLLLSACSALSGKNENNPLNFAEVVKKMEGPKVPTMQGVQVEEAKKSISGGNVARAVSIYTQLVNDYPDNIAYQLGLADSLRLQGDTAKARDSYTKVIGAAKKEETSLRLDAVQGKGLCYIQEGNFPEAIALFNTVLKEDTTRWRTMNALAVALSLTGKKDEADKYYANALKLSDGNPMVLNNMGLSQAFNGHAEDAIAPLEKASNALASTAPERKRVDLNLALIYGLNNRSNDAERVSKPYLSEAAIYNNLGVYAMLRNDKLLAKGYLQKALSSSPVHYQRAWENLQKIGG